ncbi:transposase [Streptomyces mirabilis]
MAVRATDWKYALGAELTDTGFDASVLSRFRSRLAGHGMERVVFDRLPEHCKHGGLVVVGGRQRTNSTHVISEVRDLNRLELAGESMRAALEALFGVGTLGQESGAHQGEGARASPCGWPRPSRSSDTVRRCCARRFRSCGAVTTWWRRPARWPTSVAPTRAWVTTSGPGR